MTTRSPDRTKYRQCIKTGDFYFLKISEKKNKKMSSFAMLSSCSQNITTTACLAIPVFEARKPVSAGLVQCSWLLVLNISSSPPFFSFSPVWHCCCPHQCNQNIVSRLRALVMVRTGLVHCGWLLVLNISSTPPFSFFLFFSCLTSLDICCFYSAINWSYFSTDQNFWCQSASAHLKI